MAEDKPTPGAEASPVPEPEEGPHSPKSPTQVPVLLLLYIYNWTCRWEHLLFWTSVLIVWLFLYKIFSAVYLKLQFILLDRGGKDKEKE